MGQWDIDMANIEYFLKRIKERGYNVSCVYKNMKYKKVTATNGKETITGSISAIYNRLFGKPCK